MNCLKETVRKEMLGPALSSVPQVILCNVKRKKKTETILEGLEFL